MFKVSLTNFGILFPDSFETFEAAVVFVKSKGFEATIFDTKNVVGSWSPIGGTRRF
jgi:hypothetical protein